MFGDSWNPSKSVKIRHRQNSSAFGTDSIRIRQKFDRFSVKICQNPSESVRICQNLKKSAKICQRPFRIRQLSVNPLDGALGTFWISWVSSACRFGVFMSRCVCWVAPAPCRLDLTRRRVVVTLDTRPSSFYHCARARSCWRRFGFAATGLQKCMFCFRIDWDQAVSSQN